MTTSQNGDDDREPTRDRINFRRPVDSVADDPVGRPLGVLGLHLGNRHAAAADGCEYAFDAVRTLSSE